MKKIYLPLFAIAALVLLSANVANLEKTNFFSVDPLEPVLPDVPYNYDLTFPEHVLSGGWSFVDTSLINSQISPEGATLGRVLFYDKKLSASNEVSCASCHKQAFAFADDVQFSEGIGGALTERNSPNLNDLVWGGGGGIIFSPGGFGGSMLFWDARETDLEEMVLQPITHQGELGKDLAYLLEKLSNTEYYPALFEEAFGDPEITAERIGDALAQFIRSMASFDSKFDRVMKSEATFTAQEQVGHQVFSQSCGIFCHGEPHFGSSMPMNNGLDENYADLGLASWTGIPEDIGKFKSPSLRNVALTAPYMHDGRFATLEEVVDFYSEGVFPHPNNDFFWVTNTGPDFTGFDFTDAEKAALVAFLHTLTDQTIMLHPKWSDPFQEVTGSHFLPLEEKISIFPNPVSRAATVQFDNPGGERYSLRLTSVQGRVLKSFETSGTQVALEKGDLPAGVYLLEIRKDNRKKIERIVMQ